MEMMTKAEREKVEQRLALLKANRPVISLRIAEARALGDLKENGDYHAAREQQGMEEAEIRRLEDRLAHAQVVEDGAGKGGDIVMLGSSVRIKDVEKGRVDTVKLVGEMSADPPEDYDEVTVSSPMGEALLKARVGEVIRVNAPRGVKRFEIVEIV
ncbi:MAG: transcription elongation factor GreA [Phycisphaerae bacterium]|nr:transcription elongation factor GreA [Phycisphaerae bacterium]